MRVLSLAENKKGAPCLFRQSPHAKGLKLEHSSAPVSDVDQSLFYSGLGLGSQIIAYKQEGYCRKKKKKKRQLGLADQTDRKDAKPYLIVHKHDFLVVGNEMWAVCLMVRCKNHAPPAEDLASTGVRGHDERAEARVEQWTPMFLMFQPQR